MSSSFLFSAKDARNLSNSFSTRCDELIEQELQYIIDEIIRMASYGVYYVNYSPSCKSTHFVVKVQAALKERGFTSVFESDKLDIRWA